MSDAVFTLRRDWHGFQDSVDSARDCNELRDLPRADVEEAIWHLFTEGARDLARSRKWYPGAVLSEIEKARKDGQP